MFLFTTPPDGSSGSPVRLALQQASEKTGASFDYLLNTAQRESNFDVKAQAPTSSARGLFQFIESTWLSLLRDAGEALGYGDYADRIATDSRGRAVVKDPSARAEILGLRDDPELSALMAGELARRNGASIESALGRKAQQGELYLAHFLGARGAVDLITLAQSDPEASAAEAFPTAARANRPIFYAKDGNPRSAEEVYRRLTAVPANSAAPAASSQAAETVAAQAEDPSEPLAPQAFAPFTARRDPDAPFHSLFSDTSRGLGPIARAVGSMWRREDPMAAAAQAGAGQGTEGVSGSPSLAQREAARTLLSTDGRPLDISPGAVDDAIEHYRRAGRS